MAFVLTSLGSLADTVARSDYTCTLSRAPADNTLVIVEVHASGSTSVGVVVEPSSVSGSGLVFSIITSSVTYAGDARNFSVWRSMGAGLSNSVITAHFPSNTSGCAVLVTEVSGVSTSGTSGANAVGKSATSSSGVTNSFFNFAPSATSTANAWFVGWGNVDNDSDDSAGQNYTILDRTNFATPSTAIGSAWTTLSTATMAWIAGTGDSSHAGTMVELVLDNPAAAAASTGARAHQFRLVTVPSSISGPVGSLLRLWERQLNAEAYISRFSAADPNTSGLTGIPGNLAVNVGSASSWSRLWLMAGSVASYSTTSWHPVRVA